MRDRPVERPLPTQHNHTKKRGHVFAPHVRFKPSIPTVSYAVIRNSGVPRNFFRVVWGGEVQQIQLRTEGKENGDLGAITP
jgi:hypothetical protein